VPLLRFLAKEYRAVLGPGVPAGEVRLRLGRVLAARGLRDEAVAELRQAAEEANEPFARSLAHLCLGRLAQTAEDAARSYSAATDADPLLRQAWLGRSETAWRMHEHEAALAALDRAFADPDERLTSWIVYHLGRGRAFADALGALRVQVMAAARRSGAGTVTTGR
jgi:tetratricopeptide (TPR) repeat protein